MRQACFVMPAAVAAAIFAGVSAMAARAQQTVDPRDFSGHWERTTPDRQLRQRAERRSRQPHRSGSARSRLKGRKRYDANKPGYGPRRSTQRNDPLGRCEPLGLPRQLNAEIVEPHSTWQIVQTPGRILQFFEYRHDWREIWMDGRALPAFEGRRAEVERLLGRPVGRQHARRRVDRLRRQKLD